MQPFVVRKTANIAEPWALYERLPAAEHKQIKLVSRHPTRVQAREAMRQLMQEESRAAE